MKKGSIQDKLIIRFKGGLGNQMFQYAMYRKQKYLGRQVRADISCYEEKGSMPFVLCDVFPGISLEFVKPEEAEYYLKRQKEKGILEKIIASIWWERRDYTSEKEDGFFDKRVLKLKKGFLDGYWQSEKYFLDIREKLLSDFQFQISDKSLKKYTETITNDAVSVHIRRGDYLKFPELFGGICDMNYYKKAMDYFRDKNAKTVFYVFSDDKEWVKKTFSDYPVRFVDKSSFSSYQDWYDMYLMSRCQHNIIANSSFSWWGAWLNINRDKEVIAPGKWINKKQTKDIWCQTWKKI